MNTPKLRGAVIGYGFISGKGHVPAYQERASGRGDVQIVAIADICEARRALAQEQCPQARIYSDYRALLDQEAGNLDFVDISTPPCDHAPIALAAMERRLHVLCEKPLTTTLAEARSLLQKAKETKRVIFPCHNYKHAPVVKAIREVIASGQIGRVRSVTLNTYRNTHAKGVTEWKTHWRREKKYSGGGIAMDHGSHTFYLTFDWLNSYPTAVTAKMSNLEPATFDRHYKRSDQDGSSPYRAKTGHDGQFDTEDNFTAALTFPTGLAHVHLTWTAGVRKVIYTIQGERGAITVDDDDLQIAQMQGTSGPDVAQGAVKWEVEKKSIASHWMDASHVSWFNSLFDQFQEAISKGDFVGKEAQEAYLCIQLIETAYRSAREGCREFPLAALDV